MPPRGPDGFNFFGMTKATPPSNQTFLSACDTFNIARNCPGTPSYYCLANGVAPYPTKDFHFGLNLSKLSVGEKVEVEGSDPRWRFGPRTDITHKFVVFMYLPIVSGFNTRERKSGFVGF